MNPLNSYYMTSGQLVIIDSFISGQGRVIRISLYKLSLDVIVFVAINSMENCQYYVISKKSVYIDALLLEIGVYQALTSSLNILFH